MHNNTPLKAIQDLGQKLDKYNVSNKYKTNLCDVNILNIDLTHNKAETLNNKFKNYIYKI